MIVSTGHGAVGASAPVSRTGGSTIRRDLPAGTQSSLRHATVPAERNGRLRAAVGVRPHRSCEHVERPEVRHRADVLGGAPVDDDRHGRGDPVAEERRRSD